MAISKPDKPHKVKYAPLPQIDETTHLSASSFPTVLSTPRRPRANSGAKRRQLAPKLDRPHSSPSHRNRVAGIFSDAADHIRRMSLPRPKPWSRKVSIASSVSLGRRAAGSFQETKEPIHEDERCGLLGPTRTHGSDSSGESIHLPEPMAGEGGDGDMDFTRTAHRAPQALGREPVSSGFTSPVGRIRALSPAIITPRSPTPGPLRVVNNIEDDCNIEDEIHSTHGVPLVLPVRSVPQPPPTPAERVHANVSAWLDQVLVDTPHSSHNLTAPHCSLGAGLNCPSVRVPPPQSGSNKENIRPNAAASDASDPQPGLPPQIPPATDEKLPLLSSPPIRLPRREPLKEIAEPASSPLLSRLRPSPMSPKLRLPSLSPGGLMSIAPRRKRPRPASSPDGEREDACRASMGCIRGTLGPRLSEVASLLPPGDGGDGGETEEKGDEKLPLLSGSIEMCRKGKAPSPNRRPSYWDRDILEPRGKKPEDHAYRA